MVALVPVPVLPVAALVVERRRTNVTMTCLETGSSHPRPSPALTIHCPCLLPTPKEMDGMHLNILVQI